MNKKQSHCKPHLADSQLSFRIDLARKRIGAYPLDNETFIYADLERPESFRRMADMCSGDLTGRLLEALSAINGIDGHYFDEHISKMFSRIINQTQESGLIGKQLRYDGTPKVGIALEIAGGNKLFSGLIEYYNVFGDDRALEAAKRIAEYILAHSETWLEKIFRPEKPANMYCWIVDAFSMLYNATKEERYLEFISKAKERYGIMEYSHSHGLLMAMRGFAKMAYYSNDDSWMDLPEKFRNKIIQNKWETGSGDISEYFPKSQRNEICSTADWAMLNLWSGFVFGDDAAYEKAEHVLWNALYFGQIVTGGAGHRTLIPRGYGNDEFQEAWWCCTESFLLACREFARNVVTKYKDEYRINFLIPGDYEIDGIKFNISTRWPEKVDAVIKVDGIDENTKLHLRIPSMIKNAKEIRESKDGSLIIRLNGDIGYTINEHDGLYMLKYGPLVLAPFSSLWNGKMPDEGTTVPEGYIPNSFPGVEYTVELPEKDENGFYKFSHDPFPEWNYFEEGTDSRTSFNRVSVNVKMKFDCGIKGVARFRPMCYSVSTLTFYVTPFMFDIEK